MSSPTSEPLPPLFGRMLPGEFGTLVQELLWLDGAARKEDRHLYSYVVAVRPFDGMAGPAHIAPVWGRGPGQRDAQQHLQHQVLPNLVGLYLPQDGPCNLVLVYPADPTPEEERWLAQRRLRPGLAIRAWGPSRLEPFFRRRPALFARYYPERARGLVEGYDGFDLRAYAARYREKLVLLHGRPRLLGLPPEILREPDARAEIPLSDLFVPPRFLDEKATSPMDLASLLREPRVVVLGDPGMGKSTLLAFLTLLFAGGATLGGFEVPTNTVPLLVPLRDLAREKGEGEDLSFVDYLVRRARTDLAIEDGHRIFFDALLQMGHAAVLFDGLDEVVGVAARHRVAEAIRAFQAEYPRCLVWVTSRVHGYTADIALPREPFKHVRIAPLDDAQIEDFLKRWYASRAAAPAGEVEGRRDALRRAVLRTPSVRRLADNPLLLTLAAFIHGQAGELPRDRWELYEVCVEMLLRSWQEARRAPGDEAGRGPLDDLGLPPIVQRDYLAHLALYLQERGEAKEGAESRGLMTREEAIEQLAARHFERARRTRPDVTAVEAHAEMSDLLDYIGEHTGLLVDRGGDKLSFLHLTFQEYLAAWAFLAPPDAGGGAKFFLSRIGDPAWQEVLLLRLHLVLHAPGGGGDEAFDGVVATLLKDLERRDVPEGWLFLCRALRDRLDLRSRDRRDVLGRVVEGWLEAPTLAGKWFDALNDLRLFAPPEVLDALRDLLAERQRTAPPAQAIACLHLESLILGAIPGAAGRFSARADLPEMLADLAVFMDDPAVASLLAEKADVRDFEAALTESRNDPDLYRLVLAWATGGAPCPAAAEAGVRLLGAKIAEEVRSRAAFAKDRAGSDAASVFRAPAKVRIASRFSSVDAPLAAWVVPGRTALHDATRYEGPRLLHGELASTRRLAVPLRAEAPAAALARWVSSWVSPMLQPFVARGRLDADKLDPVAFAVAKELQQGLLQEHWSVMLVVGIASAFMPMSLDSEKILGEAARKIAQRFDRGAVDEVVRVLVDGALMTPAILIAHVESESKRAFLRDLAPSFAASHGRDFLQGLGLATGMMDLGVGRLPILSNQGPLPPGAAGDPAVVLDLLGQANGWAAASTASRRHGSVDLACPADHLAMDLRNPLALPALLECVVHVAVVNHGASLLRWVATMTPDAGGGLTPIFEWLRRHPFEVHLTALAWEEHVRDVLERHGRLEGAGGALVMAVAEYASLVSGLLPDGPVWTRLVAERDPSVDAVLARVARPAPGATRAGPASAAPTAAPEPVPVFTWLHLSDIHLGYESAGQRWDQKLVLGALLDDLRGLEKRDIPKPDVVLVTGDIAWTGTAAQYDEARAWLSEVVSAFGLDLRQVFAVPGNHDIDRATDGERETRRLVRNLRDAQDPEDNLDAALDDATDRARLFGRRRPYLDFAARLGSQAGAPFWSFSLGDRGGIGVHLVGLDTALLAQGDDDGGKLRLGKRQLGDTLPTPALADDQLVIVLSHHPFTDQWLADQPDVEGWVRKYGTVHLSGHVHGHESERVRSGGGDDFVRISAGAVHAGATGPASHGYSVGAVCATPDGAVRLRVYPRRFSDKHKDFRTDVANVPQGRAFAEHPLPRVRRRAR